MVLVVWRYGHALIHAHRFRTDSNGRWILVLPVAHRSHNLAVCPEIFDQIFAFDMKENIFSSLLLFRNFISIFLI